MADKRKFIRFDNPDIRFKTRELQRGRAAENVVQAVAVNMSAEGICFMSAAKLKPGTRIEFDLVMPYKAQPAHLEGEVMWCNPVKTEDGKEMYKSGVRISSENSTKFLVYICDKMQQRIRQLEEELDRHII